MDSKSYRKDDIRLKNIEPSERSLENSEEKSLEKVEKNIESLCDENLTTLKKIHAILINCINLSKQKKLEFCESERFFMKLYLKKLQNKNEK
ncbi:MAG: hypothetical protein ACFE9S_04320 [Candidatus Hermodarchaeota archaeon]